MKENKLLTCEEALRKGRLQWKESYCRFEAQLVAARSPENKIDPTLLGLGMARVECEELREQLKVANAAHAYLQGKMMQLASSLLRSGHR